MLSYTTLCLSLITIHISDCCQFSDIHISRGSVATYLRCVEIYTLFCCKFTDESVSEILKSVNICRSYGREFSVLFFGSQCIHVYVVHVIYRVGQKTELFFRLDNFVTVSPRKPCSMSKISKFYPEKGTKLAFQ